MMTDTFGTRPGASTGTGALTTSFGTRPIYVPPRISSGSAAGSVTTRGAGRRRSRSQRTSQGPRTPRYTTDATVPPASSAGTTRTGRVAPAAMRYVAMMSNTTRSAPKNARPASAWVAAIQRGPYTSGTSRDASADSATPANSAAAQLSATAVANPAARRA